MSYRSLNLEGCIRFGIIGFGLCGQARVLCLSKSAWRFGPKTVAPMVKKTVLKRPAASAAKWTPQGDKELS